MQLDSFTGVTEKKGLKCYKPINHVVLVVSGTGYASILDAEIRVDLFEGAKSTNIVPTTKIAAIAAFKGRVDGLSTMVKKSGEIIVLIPVCHGGGLSAGVNSSYANIEITGLLATQTVTVLGLETTNGNGFPIRYTNLEINSDQKKMKFSNNGQFEFIMLPFTGLVSLKAYFADGGTPEFLPNELLALNMSENELTYLSEVSSATSQQAQIILNDYAVLDVSNMREWEIEKVAGSAYKYVAVDLVID